MEPKKRFSQNFLRDTSIVERIVREGRATDFDWVIEIGAGEGALTEALVKKNVRHIIAFELDHDLIPILLRRFPPSSNVSIVEADFLRSNIEDTLKKNGFPTKGPGESWSIFGNIPYGITGQIIRKLIAHDRTPNSIILMVQKEVAERITRKDGKGSMLSLATELFGRTDMLFTVPQSAFFPEPKVESAVICINPDPDRLPNEDRERILRLARIGFSSKRKTLANNFSANREYAKETIEGILETIGKGKNIRAEEMKKGDWIQFFSLLQK